MGVKEDIEYINSYRLDNSKIEKVFNKLLPYRIEDQFNVFEVLKITQTEIRHSNVLSYLLDVNGNHNLNSQFLRLFLSFLQECNYNNGKNILNDIDSYKVNREMDYLDITLVNPSEKVIIVIENKINSEDYEESEDGRGQLRKYREQVEEKYIGYTQIFLYLTPLGDEPNDKEELIYWHLLSYRAIYDNLNKLYFDEKVSEKVKSFIEDYKEVIKRYVMEADKELEDICTEIYNENRQFFNLVINNKRDYALDVVKDFCQQYEKEITILPSDRKNYVYFTTPDIDKYLMENSLKEKTIYYDIEVRNSNIDIYIILNYKNNSDENKNKIEEYFKKIGLVIKNKDNDYVHIGRLFRTDETSEEEIENFLYKKLSKYINF